MLSAVDPKRTRVCQGVLSKLSSISLRPQDNGKSAYVDLLCPYGAQLRFTHLWFMALKDGERIVASC